MDKLLPIEPDCLCVVTIGVQAGVVFTVKKFMGDMGAHFPGISDYWEVDQEMEYQDQQGKINLFPYWPAAAMMRIDGHNDQARHTEKERPVENVA